VISEPPSGTQVSASRILIAVCTYNEADNISALLNGLREYVATADLLVVDDDSPDGTALCVTQFMQAETLARSTVNGQSELPPTKTHLVVRQGQRGLGGAIKRAIQFAIEGDYDLFVNLDGDLSHSPAQIPRLIEAITDSRSSGSSADVVVGSRYLPGGEIIGWRWRRRVMSRLVNRFATRFLRLPVSDCSGSMRCYRVSALKRIDTSKLRSEGYALLEELLVALARNGAKLAEVPVTFTDREHGKSKLTTIEALRSAFQILKLAFRSD
jgi:dolichol-phosphate mannosyltransferase